MIIAYPGLLNTLRVGFAAYHESEFNNHDSDGNHCLRKPVLEGGYCLLKPEGVLEGAYKISTKSIVGFHMLRVLGMIVHIDTAWRARKLDAVQDKREFEILKIALQSLNRCLPYYYEGTVVELETFMITFEFIGGLIDRLLGRVRGCDSQLLEILPREPDCASDNWKPQLHNDMLADPKQRHDLVCRDCMEIQNLLERLNQKLKKKKNGITFSP